MRTVLILFGNELRRFLHDKTALSLTFLVPTVLIYIFGHVFGVNDGGGGPTGIPIAVVSATDAPVVAAITSALQKEKAFKVLTTETQNEKEVPLTEARVREKMRAGSLRFALIFPPDTQSDESFGLKLKFLHNPRNEIETQTVTGLVQKTIYTSAPQALLLSLQKKGANFIGQENFDQFNHSIANAIAQGFGGNADEIYANLSKGDFGLGADTPGASSSLFESLIKIDSEQVGGRQVKSSMATRSVGGWAIMFLLFSLSGAATSLFDEKKAGLFQRSAGRAGAADAHSLEQISLRNVHRAWCNCARFSSPAAFCSESISRPISATSSSFAWELPWPVFLSGCCSPRSRPPRRRRAVWAPSSFSP